VLELAHAFTSLRTATVPPVPPGAAWHFSGNPTFEELAVGASQLGS
jgi:hypothetical protein